MEITLQCIACGYPMIIDKEVAGSIKKAKKVKMKCTSEDCTYTEILKTSREEYNEDK